jgi:hypothetical protein
MDAHKEKTDMVKTHILPYAYVTFLLNDVSVIDGRGYMDTPGAQIDDVKDELGKVESVRTTRSDMLKKKCKRRKSSVALQDIDI